MYWREGKLNYRPLAYDASGRNHLYRLVASRPASIAGDEVSDPRVFSQGVADADVEMMLLLTNTCDQKRSSRVFRGYLITSLVLNFLVVEPYS